MLKLILKNRAFLGLALGFFLVGCIGGGVKKTGKVVGYRDGEVLTKKGSYRVGELPPAWKRVKLGKALVAFRNREFQSTISTDSFCDQAYDDSSLKMLTRHLFAGLQDTQVVREDAFSLDGRGALRSVVQAKLDGLPVTLDLVVVKKDWCLFDFHLVSAPERYSQAVSDFEKFYQGFSYSGGI
jgi:hypothetical protein